MSGEYTLGKLNLTSGQSTWEVILPFKIGKINRFAEGGGNLSNSILVTGNVWEGIQRKGKIAIYDQNGNQLSSMTISKGDTSVVFNDMIYNGDLNGSYHFLAVGRIGINNVFKPYIAEFICNAQGVLAKVSETIFSGLNNYSFWNIIKILESNQYCYYIASSRYYISGSDSTVQNVAIHKIDGVNQLWKYDIIHESGMATLMGSKKGINYFNGKIYLSAYTNVQKGTAPTNGGFWHDGLLTCLTSNGALVWEKTYRASNHSDVFESTFIENGKLFLIGKAASHYYPDNNDIFAYGWLVKADAETGIEEANWTFGNENYSSGCNAGIYYNGYIYTGGYTNYEYYNGNFNDWLVKINPNGKSTNKVSLLKTPQLDIQDALPVEKRDY